MTLRHKRYFDTDEEVDDAVEEWHLALDNDESLPEFLGWTWKEYGRWVEHPSERPRR